MPDSKSFQIAFSLPNSKDLYFFENGSGGDQFHFQAFDRNQPTLVFEGIHQSIDLTTALDIISKWKLNEKPSNVNETIDGYEMLVEKGIDSIKSNESNKIVLAALVSKHSATKKETLFESLYLEHSNAFVYALMFDGFCMLGASPETLLRKTGVTLQTEALGGTLNEGGQYSEKELIEHEQIQSELEAVFRAMAYEFTQSQIDIKKAGKVAHLRTKYELVSKGLREDLKLRDALHPTPAVCGLPRESAKRFIDKFENFDRKFYAGFLGPVFSNGDFYSMVNLRCTEAYSNQYVLYAGAGINVMSVPQDELLEIKRKLKTIADHLK